MNIRMTVTVNGTMYDVGYDDFASDEFGTTISEICFKS